MNTYTIERATGAVPLTGTVGGTPWEGAREAVIDTFPWDEDVRDPPATVRALYDDEAAYAQYHVPDGRIQAVATELNGRVWDDSAIEWFFAPDPASDAYCNFEANCTGQFLFGWHPIDGEDRRIDPETAADVEVATSVEGPTTEPSDADDSWWLAIRLPFDVLESFTGERIAPQPGDRWRGNFHRLSSDAPATVGVWNPIEVPERDLHRPGHFGELRFA